MSKNRKILILIMTTFCFIGLIISLTLMIKWKSDVDDNKFVDCAVAADAEYIVTNDTHFNILQEIPWPKVNVINIKDFVINLE